MLIRGVNFYPVIGVVVGLFDVLIFWLFSLFMPKMFAALCAVLAELCITGGFHLDGLSDTADAIYSARTKERMLEIIERQPSRKQRRYRICYGYAFQIYFDFHKQTYDCGAYPWTCCRKDGTEFAYVQSGLSKRERSWTFLYR